MARVKLDKDESPTGNNLDVPDGRVRLVIEGVEPEVDGGRFPIKRVIGEKVVVEADLLVDGRDLLSAALRYKKEDDPEWTEVAMEALVNDRWRGEF